MNVHGVELPPHQFYFHLFLKFPYPLRLRYTNYITGKFAQSIGMLAKLLIGCSKKSIGCLTFIYTDLYV
ncbi:hypothetical protein XELAEV_18025954mg [Xenopus laevis]|uniref:Uncharacterized protein n=1 Tax=Xenopus laevis TaxID=8355 RepID=A0A974D2Y7_XENLA|nr:hypothetical protein XELAEV_18025954mg [Xenopus laevis]